MPYKGLTNESDPLLNTEPTSADSGGGGRGEGRWLSFSWDKVSFFLVTMLYLSLSDREIGFNFDYKLLNHA